MSSSVDFFSVFFLRVCVRGGLSYCQCQLDFMPSFLSIWVDSSLYETIILPPTLCVFSAIGGKGRIPFYSCHPFLLVKVRESKRRYWSTKWDSFSFGVMQGCSGNITCSFALVFRCLHAQHMASHRPFACSRARLPLTAPCLLFVFTHSFQWHLWANKLGFPSN